MIPTHLLGTRHGEHLVEDTCKAVDVHSFVIRSPGTLFNLINLRGIVVWSTSQEVLLSFQYFFDIKGVAKVSQDWVASCGDEDVFGLDVTVRNASEVHNVQLLHEALKQIAH